MIRALGLIYSQFGSIQVLKSSPIPQTSNWSRFFLLFLTANRLLQTQSLGNMREKLIVPKSSCSNKITLKPKQILIDPSSVSCSNTYFTRGAIHIEHIYGSVIITIASQNIYNSCSLALIWQCNFKAFVCKKISDIGLKVNNLEGNFLKL